MMPGIFEPALLPDFCGEHAGHEGVKLTVTNCNLLPFYCLQCSRAFSVVYELGHGRIAMRGISYRVPAPCPCCDGPSEKWDVCVNGEYCSTCTNIEQTALDRGDTKTDREAKEELDAAINTAESNGMGTERVTAATMKHALQAIEDRAALLEDVPWWEEHSKEWSEYKNYAQHVVNMAQRHRKGS